MHEVTVFVGGSVGSDPYSDKTWSGSSKGLLEAKDNAKLLCRAIGFDLSAMRKRLLLLKNIHRDRAVWRQHFYGDPRYRRALTEAAKSEEATSAVLLQLGSMFNLSEAFPRKTCVSYHDGNLAERLKSGHEMRGVSARRLDEALRYEEEVSCDMAAVFTFSEYLRQSFVHDYHVPAERVHNIGGGVNLPCIPEADPGKDYARRKLLFIGSEFKRKGGMELLEAFARVKARMPDAELHIAGPRALESTPAGVVFHGHLSKADATEAAQLDGLFRQASIFVLPSLYEPFGIAPLEAMLHGLPCVVTDGWALREMVTDGVNGKLVERGSAEGLAKVLLEMLERPDELGRMGKAGRARALERYTWPQVVERMSAVIGSL